MNIKLYNAVCAHLRAKAIEALAMVDILLNDPSSTPENTTTVEEITRHTLDMVQHEGALHSLQQYFQPQPAPVARPPSADPPVVVTPEMSPTYKKSLEKQKIKETAKRPRSARKKDE
jgi:hypothetical protein